MCTPSLSTQNICFQNILTIEQITFLSSKELNGQSLTIRSSTCRIFVYITLVISHKKMYHGTLPMYHVTFSYGIVHVVYMIVREIIFIARLAHDWLYNGDIDRNLFMSHIYFTHTHTHNIYFTHNIYTQYILHTHT